MLQVDLLLSCSHIVTVPTESVLTLPVIGTVIRCAICEENSKISRVGSPYRTEHINPKSDKQKSMLGDE